MNDNKTMMQYFEWYLPDDGLHWKRTTEQAKELAESGINMVWLPPAYKGAAGNKSVGYDVYDTYDLGEFEQKGSIATKYGTKKEYTDAVKALQKQGIEVLADVVLNHMMGADGTEEVVVEEDCGTNRDEKIADKLKISAWTKFEFAGRQGKYSDFKWNASNFSGTDWDDAGKRNGIFCFEGKSWNRETDSENGNYDYLMGADLDTDNPDTVRAVTEWGKWYLDTVHMDGFRLDAVKHISFDFYRKWISDMKEHKGTDFFTVGEYWSPDVERLIHYLDVVENSMSLFDVPLHFAFNKAANGNGEFDMGTIFSYTLVSARAANAVTFVDNHDTQPGQALYSFIPAWFKPIAYALILLRDTGVPCVFYGDYYGIPHDGVAPVAGLKKLCKARALYAYGQQRDYFDDNSIVGFTREGDEHQNSGLAVLVTDSVGGKKKMLVNKAFSGERFYNILSPYMEPVIIDADGYGEFSVNDGSASVWVREKAYELLSCKFV